MCLVLFQHQPDAAHRLLLIGNRDELHQRPAAGLGWWPGGDILAGRDLLAGGSWMGVDRRGRFALVTNVREPQVETPADAPSRGALVQRFLAGEADAEGYAAELTSEDHRYAGYNLLLMDERTLICHSNRYGTLAVTPGSHGLSNAALDEPWPKVERGRAGLAELGDDPGLEQRAWALLAEDEIADDGSLPDTGVGLEWERRLSSLFVRGERYGTRASSLLRIGATVRFAERRYAADGSIIGVHREGFTPQVR